MFAGATGKTPVFRGNITVGIGFALAAGGNDF